MPDPYVRLIKRLKKGQPSSQDAIVLLAEAYGNLSKQVTHSDDKINEVERDIVALKKDVGWIKRILGFVILALLALAGWVFTL